VDKIEDIIEYMPTPLDSIDITLIASALLIILLIIYKSLKYLFRRREKDAKTKLKELKVSNKESLFKFTHLAKEIDNSKKLQNLLKELEPYKYSKTQTKVPNELIKSIREYIDGL